MSLIFSRKNVHPVNNKEDQFFITKEEKGVSQQSLRSNLLFEMTKVQLKRDKLDIIYACPDNIRTKE